MKPFSEPPSSERLERLIDDACRALPERRAPRTLEQRVLAEVARRAALPWWRRSFVHWPAAARGAFTLLLAGAVALVLMATASIADGFAAAEIPAVVATPVAWIEGARSVVHAVAGFGEIIVRNIPPLWIYAGLGLLGALYAALFGLSAAAYHTLHARR